MGVRPILVIALSAIPAAGLAVDTGGVKLPEGTKLPPQPNSWTAPVTRIQVPSAPARWSEKWIKGRYLPVSVAAHCAVARDRDIYVIGGVTGREALGLPDVWRSRLDKRGLMGPWKRMQPLPAPVAFGAAVMTGDRIYVIGGSNREAIQLMYDKVFSAPVKGNGKIGKWREERAIPEAMRHHAAAACGDYLYVLGGFNGREYVRLLRYARINSGGSLGEWKEAQALYPHPVGRTCLTCIDGELLVAGGMNSDSQGEHINSLVRRGKPAADGDVPGWSDEGGLKIPSRSMHFGLAEHACASDGRFIYSVSGRDPFSLGVPTTLASWLNPRKKRLTRWQFGPPLPLFDAKGAPQDARLYNSAAVVAGEQILVLGGFLYVRQMTNLVWRMPLKPYREPSWLKAGK